MSFLSRLFRRTDSTRLAAHTFVAERDPAAPVLDVRTPREYASGHLAGALNVDLNDPGFRARIDELAADGTLERTRPVYLYCRSGNRSGQAVRVLRQKGFDAAYNIGGLSALEDAGAQVDG